MTNPTTDAPTPEAILRPCPFCNGGMQFRKALWPSDGNTDAIIHDSATDCPLVEFEDGTIDESIIARWNAALDTFAAARVKAAVEEEREECLAALKAHRKTYEGTARGLRATIDSCIVAIMRARGEKP